MGNNENRTNETCVIAKLMPQALAELRAEKICLIEDIFRVRRLCHGLGIPGNDHIVKDPVPAFDAYYECNIEALELELAIYSAFMSRKVKSMAGFRDNEFPSQHINPPKDDGLTGFSDWWDAFKSL